MKTPRSLQRGITFVESAAYLAVVSVMLGSGLPSLVDARQARQLDLAVAELRTDIQLARSAAVATGQTVRLQIRSSARGACYVIHTGPTTSCGCEPAAAGFCAPGSQLIKGASLGPAGTLAISSNAAALAFDGTQGTVTPTGTVTATNARGDQLKLVVNVMGRTRTCRSAGTISGHPRC